MFRNLEPGAIGVSSPFEMCVEWATGAGYEGIGVPVHYALSTGAQFVRDLILAHGLKPGSFGLSVDFRSDNTAFENSLKNLPKEAKIASLIGTTRCSTWVLPGRADMDDRSYFDLLKHRLGECARILADQGIRLGLEFIGPKTLRDALGLLTPGINTAEKMLDLVAAINIKGTGLLLDSYHWYTSHGTMNLFNTLTNELVVDVHINDAPRDVPVDEQLDNRRCLPGTTGVIDLGGFFSGLRKIGYDGPVTVEPFDEQLNKMEDQEAIKLVADHMKKFL